MPLKLSEKMYCSAQICSWFFLVAVHVIDLPGSQLADTEASPRPLYGCPGFSGAISIKPNAGLHVQQIVT